MRFEQLECLLAVEETGSFVGAAQKLFLTQQAISMSMKQLEQELGQPVTVVATGGMSRFILPLCRREIHYDADLLLKGLVLLYENNKKQ